MSEVRLTDEYVRHVIDLADDGEPAACVVVTSCILGTGPEGASFRRIAGELGLLSAAETVAAAFRPPSD